MAYCCRSRAGLDLYATDDLLAACAWHRAHAASVEVVRLDGHQAVPLLVRVAPGGLPAFSRRRRAA